MTFSDVSKLYLKSVGPFQTETEGTNNSILDINSRKLVINELIWLKMLVRKAEVLKNSVPYLALQCQDLCDSLASNGLRLLGFLAPHNITLQEVQVIFSITDLQVKKSRIYQILKTPLTLILDPSTYQEPIVRYMVKIILSEGIS